jgi:hypothetical protein
MEWAALPEPKRQALLARLAEPDVAGLPEWAAAAALNAPDAGLPTARVHVATSDVYGHLLTTGEWPPIIMAAEAGGGAQEAVRGLCILVRDTLQMTSQLETGKPERYAAVVQVLAGLKAASLISASTETALLALAEAPQSWAQANGIVVTDQLVGAARGGI